MDSKTPTESGHGVEGGGHGLPRPGERDDRQVPTLPEARPCHHFGAPESDTRGPGGLLEDPHGMMFVSHMQEVIGRCQRAQLTMHTDDFGQWFEWRMTGINITHAKAMLYLHGASPQQLFSPFVLLRASPRPASHPVPGFDDVVIAGVSDSVLASTPLEELFTTLSSRVGA